MNARRIILSLGLLLLAMPLSVQAALVNINTADATTLDGLPYISSDLATAIIHYRTASPFTIIEDIMKVPGIKEGIFSHIQSLITVGDMSTTAPAPAATSTASTSAPSGGTTTYVPPPAELSIDVGGSQNALLEVPLRLSARATTKSGAADTAARITWSFGDGSSGEGSVVEKTYRYAGIYLVVVTAADGAAVARDDLTVMVKHAAPRISLISGEGITLANDTDDRLDLSGWRLLAEAGSFRIPEGMTILPKANVLFPYSIINLPTSFETMLLYPDGVVAARYALPLAPAQTVEQPSAPAVSYKQVQEVEPIISQGIAQSYDEGVRAPAAVPNEGIAAGAAQPVPPLAAVASTGLPSIFRSPWMLGLLGVVGLAGGAFILL